MHTHLDAGVKARRAALSLLDVQSGDRRHRSEQRRLEGEADARRDRVRDLLRIETHHRAHDVLDCESDAEPLHPAVAETEHGGGPHLEAEVEAGAVRRAAGQLLAAHLDDPTHPPAAAAERTSIPERDLGLTIGEIVRNDRVAVIAAFDAAHSELTVTGGNRSPAPIRQHEPGEIFVGVEIARALLAGLQLGAWHVCQSSGIPHPPARVVGDRAERTAKRERAR
ncbi:MAG: hypothetical protein E6K80_12225, partial [Candidatus Eisenbacteria bacterium]